MGHLSSVGTPQPGPALTDYVAFLRGINVGGKNLVAMGDLREWCEEAGLKGARTYIQSGNLLLQSPLSEAKLKARLEKLLQDKTGKSIRVVVRSQAELVEVLKANPFVEAEPNRVLVTLLDEKAEKAELIIPGGEQVHLHGREVYVHYPDGMGQSKLKLPYAKVGTARNLNTLQRLARPFQDI